MKKILPLILTLLTISIASAQSIDDVKVSTGLAMQKARADGLSKKGKKSFFRSWIYSK